MIEPKVFSVEQINRYIKNLLENDFILNSLLVQGEISNFKAHSSGHWYFTLKDAQGAIACVMFQQDAAQVPFLPENGMQVILYGHVSLYERTGQYQLYGEFLEPVGMGALQLAFEQMKEKLAAEGLFDADYKREIPENVGCIAVITSPKGAARHYPDCKKTRPESEACHIPDTGAGRSSRGGYCEKPEGGEQLGQGRRDYSGARRRLDGGFVGV